MPRFESGPGLQRKREAVYKWEGLRQLSRTSNESFMRVSETKGQDLEEAVRLLYADDVPAGARTAPETTSASPGDPLVNLSLLLGCMYHVFCIDLPPILLLDTV